MPLHRSALLALVMLAAPLIGCLAGDDAGATEDGAPADHVSRLHRLDLDEERLRALDRASDPFALLESYLETSLAVRVGAAGAYTLAYTTADGEETVIPLDNMAPGVPRTIPSVAAFAGATLKRGDQALAHRAPLDLDTLRAGDLPLGVQVAPGAEAVYEHALDVSSALQATDVRGPDGWLARSVDARVDVPLRGTLTMRAPLLESLLEGKRIDLNGTLRVETGAPIASLDVVLDHEGEPGRMGFEAAPRDARVEGALSLWFEDGRLAAAQPQGGFVALQSGITTWAEGSAADAWGSECRGATRDDPCVPSDAPNLSERAAPGARETLGDDTLRATRPAEQTAIAFLERALAHDLAVGDAFTLAIEMDSKDMPYEERSTYAWSFVLESKVAAKEALELKAGTFDALRVAQSARVQADVASLQDANHDWDNGTTTWEEMIRDLHVDETVARHTIWLDAATYQPLRVTSETPVQPGAVAARVLDAITDAGWSDLQVGPIPADAFTWTLTASSTLEATQISSGARFSPYAGLTLATLMGGGAGVWNAPVFVMGGLPFRAFAAGHDEAVMVESPPRPPPHHEGEPIPVATPTASPPRHGLWLSEEAPPKDGTARLRVERVSPLAWSDVALFVEDEPWVRAEADPACALPPPHGGFVACHDGSPKGGEDAVAAGDAILLGGVASGQSVRVEHADTGEILARLVLS